MLYLAVGYDVLVPVEEDLIACSSPAVYYLLGHRAKGVMPLRSVDGVVSSFPVEAVHSPLCPAAEGVVVPGVPIDVVGAIASRYVVDATVTVNGVFTIAAKHTVVEIAAKHGVCH